MGIHVLSYLKQTLKRKDKRDADWDFGARQSPDATTRTNSIQRRRTSSSLDGQQHNSMLPRTEEVPQQQHKRVSAAVIGNTHTEARANDPRSVTPEDDVLMAAGESAKESRSAAMPGKQRRRAHSIAAERLTDPSARPMLRHATSALTEQDTIPVSPSATSLRSTSVSPAPSVQSFRSVQAGLHTKRSMPQLHNVWENFLEEAAEDANSFNFPIPPRVAIQSPGKYATVHKGSRTSASPLPRHLHAPATSSSSILTTTSSASLTPARSPPRNSPSGSSQSLQSMSNRLRPRGHMRTSHQTSSSTSSAATSNAGSTSSLAAFSSRSSMTTVFDDPEDALHACDDPVPPTPQSSAAVSLKFADTSLSLPSMQRLHKSPTSPELQYRTLPRGGSPTSSTSSESCGSSTASCPHSQSTTPTPSSACPTPSSACPTPSSACPTPSPSPSAVSPMFIGKHSGRLSPGTLSADIRYGQSPDRELLEHPLSPGFAKGRKYSSSRRYSNATVSSRLEGGAYSPFEASEGGEDDDDVLSELGYYSPASSRAKTQPVSTFASPPQSHTPSGSSFIPPTHRRSSRQNLHVAAAQSAPSVHSHSLPRAKSASNIRHDARTASERPRLSGTLSSSLLWTNAAASPRAPGYLHESQSQSKLQIHARSQTLQDNQLQLMVDPNVRIAVGSIAIPNPRPGQSRLRSGSASVVYTERNALAPVRPPPAPLLDMTMSLLHPPPPAVSESASPLTPVSAVQWGYAL